MASSLVITLDTEPDNEWGRPQVPTTENARFVPRFHELCERFGFKITYLLTLEMAEDSFLQGYLKPRLRNRECEVGAHLHPWNTPPLVPVTDDDFRHHPYLYEHPEELQRAKLQTLVTAIERAYEVKPISYKAGRWGLDGFHAGLLEEMGFRVDTSVCPGVNWGPSKGAPDGNGGPNFTRAPLLPYRLSREDVCKPGSLNLWEIPPTIVFYSALGRYLPPVRKLYWSNRRVRRLFDRQRLGSMWLRPFPYMTVERLQRVATIAEASGAEILNLTFHSSELMPGGSPYNKTPEAIEGLYDRLESFLGWLHRRSTRGATLGEAAESLSG